MNVRHSEPVDAAVVGFTRPRSRPRALVVQLLYGRQALSQGLTASLASQAAGLLPDPGPDRFGSTPDGERYTESGPGLTAELLAGSTRHQVVTVAPVLAAE
ncbi:hypothetical protein AB0F07_32430 [Streptomyces fructofermentans]|uniref:hypothetical protein n=1 Tax=Streptomyces fructofermentans TaxID=152141 RepID=UPI003408FACD